jgi:hypothetical protein
MSSSRVYKSPRENVKCREQDHQSHEAPDDMEIEEAGQEWRVTVLD